MTPLRRIRLNHSEDTLPHAAPSEFLANVPAARRRRARRWLRVAHERATGRRETEAVLRLAEESVQQAHRTKSQFLSLMSHELRTPLNSILGFAELLQGQFYGALNEKQSGYLSQIARSGTHLLDLINDMLDIAKLDAGVVELSLGQVSPGDLVASAQRALVSQVRRKNIELRTEVAPDAQPVVADERKCRQILLNLLTNAVKYSPEGGHVTVRATRDGDGGLRIAVTDSGVGIEPEHQKGIFTEFYQVNRSRDEALGGTGIGLALTRRLVELHHGRIGLDSAPGQGSTFWFVLPGRVPVAHPEKSKAGVSPDAFSQGRSVPETGGTPVPPSGASNSGFAAKRVLIVEDNAVNQALLTTILDLHGVASFVTSSGEEALELLRTERPDLVLTDVNLSGGMDGLEATRRILSDPKTAGIPVLAVTASVDAHCVEQCLAAGCRACLSKPIEAGRLLDLVRQYLADGPGQVP